MQVSQVFRKIMKIKSVGKGLKTKWEVNAIKKIIIVNYNLNSKNNDNNINNVIIVMKVEQ